MFRRCVELIFQLPLSAIVGVAFLGREAQLLERKRVTYQAGPYESQREPTFFLVNKIIEARLNDSYRADKFGRIFG